MSEPKALADLSDEQVETIYAAYDSVLGSEASTIAGRRLIVEPLYRAVIAAQHQTLTPDDFMRPEAKVRLTSALRADAKSRANQFSESDR